jgi:hypothetical protein
MVCVAGVLRRRVAALGREQARRWHSQKARDAWIWREQPMAAMKPRTGDGPLEATKEGRGIVMRVPLEGGGRLVVELTPDEAAALGKELTAVTS